MDAESIPTFKFRFPVWAFLKTWNSIGQFMQALFITVVLSCLLPFQCFNQPDGTSVVTAYPDVFCWSGGEHNGMLVIGIIGVLGYGVTFSTIFLRAVFTAGVK